MDTTPATALGRLRRRIQIFLQKWRPFLERYFVEPITGATLDEVQLSTTLSALKRFHESVPNSQHSETLQCSVWQVAGGPAIRIPPSFNLPPWIIDKSYDKEFLSRLPSAMVVALAAFWMRVPNKQGVYRLTAARWPPRPINVSESLWAQLVYGVFNLFGPSDMIQAGSNALTNISQRSELRVEECLWLLNTLSELHSDNLTQLEQPFFIGICLAMISRHAPKWDYGNTPEIVLLDAVVTLVAISCFPAPIHRQETLTNSRQSPWLLLNLRNPELISMMIKDVPSGCHKQLISLLFLVINGLIWRGSNLLAVQYFGIITAKGDFPLHASALTAVAPALGGDGLSAIARMLVAPQTEDLISIVNDFFDIFKPDFRGALLKDYDDQLGASQNPDPNIFAILLIPKHISSYHQPLFPYPNHNLKNPWLRLVARVIARLDIPDGPDMDIVSFDDHRAHNMLAALSLLRYTNGAVSHYTEALFLASFLKSWELAISSLALRYYLRTIISYPNPLEPPCHLSSAVRAVFNHLLPDQQLQMGWPILGMFMGGLENLSVNWRQTFAEAFFTLSHQPLPRRRGGTNVNTPESELENILTWQYFHEKEREPQYTDLEFSGLDWMAMAWSLHLSHAQQCGTIVVGGSTQGRAQSQDSGAPMINGEFVLGALSKLLDAAPYYQIIPIIPKLREFVGWFGDPLLSEYRSMISERIGKVDRRHQEFRQFHQFHSFHCMWYI